MQYLTCWQQSNRGDSNLACSKIVENTQMPYVGSGPPPYGSDGYQGYLVFVATEACFCYRSANDSDGYIGSAHRCRRFNVTNLTMFVFYDLKHRSRITLLDFQ